MLIGVISDVHGNDIGLDACLKLFSNAGVAKIFFLGDAVGYLPDPRRAMDMLRSAGANCLLGNHDAMLLGLIEIDEQRDRVYQINASKKCISSKYIQELKGRLPYLVVEIENKTVLFVHGSPWRPLTGYVFPDTNLAKFSLLPFDAIFMGHTHRPFVSNQENILLINVGSCGLPRDQGNLASCAIYDSQSGECRIYRVPFDAFALVEHLGESIHDAVRECLLREATKEMVFGEIQG